MYSIYVTKRPTEMDHFLLLINPIPPIFFVTPPWPMVPMMWKFLKNPPWFTKNWFLVLNHLQPFPRWNEEDSGQHALYRNPLFSDLLSLGDTWNWQQKYRESRLETRKKKRLATPWFPTSIFPTDSDRKAQFLSAQLASCQAAHRTIDLGLQAAALMEIHIAQAELVRLGGCKREKHRPPVTTFSPSRRRCQTWFGGK